MAFNHTYNSDDSIQRSVIVGLANFLNDKIQFSNVWSDTDIKLVRVPFFYSFSGDERFIQDYATNWSDCMPNFIEGNYDYIPRGTFTLTGTNVLSGNLTSRFVRGYYTKVVDGELKRYNSYINSIPLSMTFNARVIVDSQLDIFRVTESLIENLYRTGVFRVNYRGFSVPTVVGFPDNYTSNKQYQFTYGGEQQSAPNRWEITFDMEVETYQPIIDKQQDMFAGHRIEHFNLTINEEKYVVGPSGSTKENIEQNNIMFAIPGAGNLIPDNGPPFTTITNMGGSGGTGSTGP